MTASPSARSRPGEPTPGRRGASPARPGCDGRAPPSAKKGRDGGREVLLPHLAVAQQGAQERAAGRLDTVVTGISLAAEQRQLHPVAPIWPQGAREEGRG